MATRPIFRRDTGSMLQRGGAAGGCGRGGGGEELFEAAGECCQRRGFRCGQRVSFVWEPQVRFISPRAVHGAEVGGGEIRRPRRVRSGVESAVLGSAAAPVRRSMRIAVNLGVAAEQVEGDAGETADMKRKRNDRENSVVSAQVGVSPRRTRSRGLLPDNPFMSPLVVEIPLNPSSDKASAMDCAATDEQMVQTVVRKGSLKRSGAHVSSGSSGVAKKVSFKMVEQPAAEVAGFRRRPSVVADGEAGSDAPLRRSKRNVVNLCAGDGVEKIAGAVSRNISTKADDEEDVGEAVDRKQKASENVEDIGYVWLLTTTNLSQIVPATKNVANKITTKLVANFGKKPSLYHVLQGANKVGKPLLWQWTNRCLRNCDMTKVKCSHLRLEPSMPIVIMEGHILSHEKGYNWINWHI